MADDITDATVADAESDADFGSGFSGKPAEKPLAKEKPESAEPPRTEEEPKPEYVQVTAKEWAEIKAVAAKTASYDQQLSRLFGTTGNIQKLLNESKTQPSAPGGRKIEIPKDAFAAMERDFPELAQQTRAALDAALSGIQGTGDNVDASKIKTMLASLAGEREREILEEDYPDWYQIVGGSDVAKGEKPDPEHPFRKWLTTKDAAYQARINGTESAAVISRAIRAFQKETKATPTPTATPRDTARADRIRGAVQPRGDNAPAPAGKSDDDEFEAGFRSR